MSDEKITLHGNQAKIDPRRDIIPRGMNYVVNDNSVRNGVLFNRLEDDADFCKKEVDQNQK